MSIEDLNPEPQNDEAQPEVAPINVFKLLGLGLYAEEPAVARCHLQMPSGLQIACNILRDPHNPAKLVVEPVGETTPTGILKIVAFANPELRMSFQKAAIAALEPHMAMLIEKSTRPKQRAR